MKSPKLSLEHCRKIKFRKYVHQTRIYTQIMNSIKLHLSDFASCSKTFFYFK